MQKQTMIVLEAATMASMVLLFLTMVHPCHAMGLPDLELLILPSFDHTPTPPPGNGCSNRGNGGNPCRPPVNEKAFAGRYGATTAAASSPLPPRVMLGATRKLIVDRV